MRTIRRTSGTPPTLQDATGPAATQGSGARREALNVKAWDEGRPQDIKFPSSHWNKPDVRGALYAMQWRVCAFCGRYLDPGGDRGDVEHFRPKQEVTDEPAHGGYWWLAYRLTNYLLSCSPCNSSFKRNWFPLSEGAARVTYATRDDLSAEARMLWLPTEDPTDEWLRINLDDPFLQVEARTGVDAAVRLVVTESLARFRVNETLRLIRGRQAVRNRVFELLDAGAEAHARRLASRLSPHSLVAREILEIRGIDLPQPAGELGYVLSTLSRELELLVPLVVAHPNRQNQREYEEILWILANLLNDPPDGDVARMQSFCNDAGLLDRVEERASRI